MAQLRNSSVDVTEHGYDEFLQAPFFTYKTGSTTFSARRQYNHSSNWNQSRLAPSNAASSLLGTRARTGLGAVAEGGDDSSANSRLLEGAAQVFQVWYEGASGYGWQEAGAAFVYTDGAHPIGNGCLSWSQPGGPCSPAGALSLVQDPRTATPAKPSVGLY